MVYYRQQAVVSVLGASRVESYNAPSHFAIERVERDRTNIKALAAFFARASKSLPVQR